MAATAKLSASLEDYLEAIFHLVDQKHVARSRDISQRLDVNRSSVTCAVQSLAEKGLVNYEPYEAITLTRRGKALAKEIVRRHEVLRDFLVKVLSIEAVKADQAACRMEHAVPSPVLERLIEFVEFHEVCPRGGIEWIQGFGYHCEQGDPETCERCISSGLEDQRSKRRLRGGDTTVVTLKELTPGQKAR